MPKTEPWLLLMHQLPPKPDSLRVRIWRALQKVGALQLKNSVYVLPASKESETRFGAIVSEVNTGGGDAFLCRSEFVQGIERKDIISMFQRDRSEKYEAIAKELRLLEKVLSKKAKPSENDLMGVAHSLGKLERQAKEVVAIDFFSAPSQASTLKLLSGILGKVAKLHGGSPPEEVKQLSSDDFQEKIWVTRSHVGVDRLSSAWLISRFIDKKADFKFVKGNEYRPARGEVRFDMFDAEFGHVGDKCTFEVLREAFSLRQTALEVIAEIIHDLDLKDSKFNRPETTGIGLVLMGISDSKVSDADRLEKGYQVLDGLYKSFGGPS